jgi:hypothetical protein
MLDAIIGIYTINSILSNLLCMRLIDIYKSKMMDITCGARTASKLGAHELYPGVLWYFEPRGILTTGSIFFHGILNPLIEH